MRKRCSMGGIKKQRGRCIGMWWVDGGRKIRVLGMVKEMSKTKGVRQAIGSWPKRMQTTRRIKSGGVASLLSWFTSPTTAGSGKMRREVTT
jgi:hypothetical protein